MPIKMVEKSGLIDGVPYFGFNILIDGKIVYSGILTTNQEESEIEKRKIAHLLASIIVSFQNPVVIERPIKEGSENGD